MFSSSLVFTFIVPKKHKDDVIDQLMLSDIASGFNIFPIMGYSKKHSAFSLEEQVRGYKYMLKFEVVIEQCELEKLKEELKLLFTTIKIRYWTTTITETGHL
ncbi:DUF3240 domain-containing protein [Pseudoalteromonas shioyasakiensis]|uniref:DUF3240 family protein n=1 Tax=Pseudoalteromonas shioyasakiensis TaxID=1190813 RepID=UPI002095BD4E|nr:DUF3240 family protein [Pseudoalteromonas shioyasakiensis]MCO6356204.1 DUF3240 domain-containing protein [Pseudoalteromonas shioyasakiensis]